MLSMKTMIFGTVLVAASLNSQARIGEMEAECEARYGKPVNEALKMHPILDGAVNHSYSYQGWNVKAAFVNGKAVRIHYNKVATPLELKDDEIQAILTGEANGGQWQEKRNFSFGNVVYSKAWVNTNSNVASIKGPGGMIFVVDTPAAQAFAQAKKAADEQQRKAAIPKF